MLSGRSDAALMEAISRGSVPAFATLLDRTSVPVRAVLATLRPGAVPPAEILAASYLEVWWLAGCHTEPGADAVAWITGIVRRRAAEAAAVGPGPQSGHAQRELAALLRRPAEDQVPAEDQLTDPAGSPGR